MVLRAPDIVQFTCPIYYVEESEGHVQIDVMRIGSLRGKSWVTYRTEDGSAKTGKRYMGASGTLIFEEGEFSKSIAIRISNTRLWEATLEFKVVLEEPGECVLGRYLSTCRVKVLDHDMFPSGKYEKQMRHGAAHEIGTLGLFAEYWRLNYSQEGNAKRTVMILVMDQLETLAKFVELYLRIYMVDTLFKMSDPSTEDRLWLPTRELTAYLLCVIYILPLFALHVWDLTQRRLNLEGRSRTYLQASLFRKYMNYDEASRHAVSGSEITKALTKECGELAEAYLSSLRAVRMLIKLGLFVAFAVKENRHNPEAICAMVVTPIIMVLFGKYRYGARVRKNAKEAREAVELDIFVHGATRNYQLVASYNKRPWLNDKFAKMVECPASWGFLVSLDGFFPKWLSQGVSCLYIAWLAPSVIHGEMKLGVLLATVSVFSEIGESFAEAYNELMKIASTAESVSRIATLLNTSTDLRAWKTANRERREKTQTLRQELVSRRKSQAAHNQSDVYLVDLIPIVVSNIVMRRPDKQMLFTCGELRAHQGTTVGIMGGRGSGKSVLLRLLCNELAPEKGSVYIPTYLRVLHVPEAEFLLNDTLYNNLIWGSANEDDVGPRRIREVLKRLGMQQTLGLIEGKLRRCETGGGNKLQTQQTGKLDSPKQRAARKAQEKRQAEKDQQDEGGTGWRSQLTHTEMCQLQLARAFLANPEVMVLSRPLAHLVSSPHAEQVTSLLKDFVEQRGLGLPQESREERRPRTVFFSTELKDFWEKADVRWKIHDGIISDVTEEVVDEAPVSDSTRDKTAPSKAVRDQQPPEVPSPRRLDGSAWQSQEVPSPRLQGGGENRPPVVQSPRRQDEGVRRPPGASSPSRAPEPFDRSLAAQLGSFSPSQNGSRTSAAPLRAEPSWRAARWNDSGASAADSPLTTPLLGRSFDLPPRHLIGSRSESPLSGRSRLTSPSLSPRPASPSSLSQAGLPIPPRSRAAALDMLGRWNYASGKDYTISLEEDAGGILRLREQAWSGTLQPMAGEGGWFWGELRRLNGEPHGTIRLRREGDGILSYFRASGEFQEYEAFATAPAVPSFGTPGND